MNIDTQGKTEQQVIEEVKAHYAKPELVRGGYYLVDIMNGVFSGENDQPLFVASKNYFNSVDSEILIGHCTNIRRLIEASKIKRILNNSKLNLSERLNAIAQAIK